MEPAPPPATPEIQTIRRAQLADHLQHTSRLAEQRDSLSRFFLLINAALVSGTAVLMDFDELRCWPVRPMVLMLISVLGAFVSFQWRQRLFDYKTLLGVRYDIYVKGETAMSWRPMAEENDELYPKDAEGKVKSFTQYAINTSTAFLTVYALALLVSSALFAAPLAGLKGPFLSCPDAGGPPRTQIVDPSRP